MDFVIAQIILGSCAGRSINVTTRRHGATISVLLIRRQMDQLFDQVIDKLDPMGGKVSRPKEE